MAKTAILLIDCPDRKGIVAAVAEFLYRHNANILHADQHQDAQRGLFLMRVEWDLDGFDLGREYPNLSRGLVEVRRDAHKITFHYRGQPGSEHGLRDGRRVKELLTRARDASIKAGQWPDRLTEIWNRRPPGSG